MNFEPENLQPARPALVRSCDRHCRLGRCYRRDLGYLHGY